MTFCQVLVNSDLELVIVEYKVDWLFSLQKILRSLFLRNHLHHHETVILSLSLSNSKWYSRTCRAFLFLSICPMKSPLEIVNKPKSIFCINIVLEAQSERGIFWCLSSTCNFLHAKKFQFSLLSCPFIVFLRACRVLAIVLQKPVYSKHCRPKCSSEKIWFVWTGFLASG